MVEHHVANVRVVSSNLIARLYQLNLDEVILSNTTTSQEQTFKTENCAVAMTRKPGCKIHLEISVSPKAVSKSYTEAIKAVNKEVSIPGFRTGKAPQALIKQRFDKQIRHEWHNHVLNEAFTEFMHTSHLLPFQQYNQSISKAEVKSISLENGAELVIEYEAKPEAPDINIAEIHVNSKPKQPVTEELVDETIHQIQLHHSKWEAVTDRPVAEGDFVDLDIEALENPPRNICQDMRFEMAPKKMGTWMRNLILGKNVNESVEGLSEKDESSLDPSQDFIPTQCKITIKAIWKAELPPLDNELAAKVGIKAIEELRDAVKKDVENRHEREHRNELRAQVEKQILEKYPFDIPASLIDKQSKNTIANRKQQINKNDYSPDRLAELYKEMEANVLIELTDAYRLFFITQQIAHRENISVYESEIYREAFNIAQQNNDYELLSNLENEEIKSKIYVNVLTAKVLDFILDKISSST